MHPKTLRIAFATPDYVTEKYFDSGIAKSIHRIAKALAARGHEIHVLTKSEIDQDEFVYEGITVHRVGFGKAWLQLNRLTRYRLTNTMHLLGLSSQVYRKLKKLNAERPFHLVQFPNASYCGLFSILLLRLPHVLRASWFQPVWSELNGMERNLDAKALVLLERVQFRFSPHIYAPSYNLQQILSKELGLSSVRVIRTPFYIETEDWDDSVYNRLLKGKKYLLFFGRFELLKGFHILAQALPRFLSQYPDACVALVGRDTKSRLAPSMADYARSFSGSSKERLILLEELPHRQLYPVVAGAHLVVLPSLIDNFPNACLEAMALGKAVIGTSGASFDELISDGETGFLVPPNNVDALAEKIIRAWEYPKLQEIGHAARQKSLEFSPEKTVESLLTYYREILQG
ncbi:MAG TPA: glycosyltransferase family 4 protein [Pyrinomonadaceae bacterium]|jgi:glycosyltransferase involved in cell wall biosynthesis